MMKPYVCGDDGVYIPDSNCNCTSADAISVKSPIEAAGQEVELANLQENLDLLLEAVNYLYSQGGSSESPWFEAGTNDTVLIAWASTKLTLKEIGRSDNSNWNIENGNLVFHSDTTETYEVSGMVTLANNTANASSFSAVLTSTYDGVEMSIATANASMQGSSRETAVISPFYYTVSDGMTLSLTVNSVMGATVQADATHIFIRKIADAMIK